MFCNREKYLRIARNNSIIRRKIKLIMQQTQYIILKLAIYKFIKSY